MFGAIIYLPVYLQVVRGVSPTTSGLMLLPIMAGLFTASIGSGQIIARIGRYKIFPIVGTALMTIGMGLFSTLTVHTSFLVTSAFMLITGFGLGLVMQVLILAVQNGVDYKDLGTATSLAAFFRSMGGAFGTALLGAVLNDRLIGNLTQGPPCRGTPHVPEIAREIVGSPAQLKLLPPSIHTAATVAYVHTIDTVFLIATPVVALAFLLSLALPEIRLRKTVHTTALRPWRLRPLARICGGDRRSRVSRLQPSTSDWSLRALEERRPVATMVGAASGHSRGSAASS